MERFGGATNRQLRLDSMEPWPTSHGNNCSSTRPSFATRYLQWSHGPLAMETRHYGPAHFFQVWDLQWSHGPLAMETVNLLCSRHYLNNLQWSHGPLAMETRELSQAVPPAYTPSMEPWPFSHGNGQSVVFPSLSQQPSMEPWPFSHGNPGAVAGRPPGLYPFNGAMAL